MEERKPICKGAKFKIGNDYGINPCKDPWVPSLEDGVPKLKEGINLNCLRRVYELKDPELEEWDVQKNLLFEAESANAILQIKWQNSRDENILIWKGNECGTFSVKESYLQIINTYTKDREWAWLWKLKIHERLKVFLWRMKAEVLPTNMEIWKRTKSGFGSCPACGAEKETFFHIFYECQSAKVVAFSSKWGLRIKKWGLTNFNQVISLCINPDANMIPSGLSNDHFTMLMVSLFYFIWNLRNNSMFKAQLMPYQASNKLTRMIIGISEMIMKIGRSRTVERSIGFLQRVGKLR